MTLILGILETFVDEKKIKPRCSIQSSPFIFSGFLSFGVSIFSYKNMKRMHWLRNDWLMNLVDADK